MEVLIVEVKFDKVYYEPAVLDYELGKNLKYKYNSLPWIEIESHNRISELSSMENKYFPMLKQHLILGIRKTHKYVENHKISDWLVPYTSSGCRAMCLYCYLVCNYNKCSYLRLFVNRDQMMQRLLKFSNSPPLPQTFEIGSNSDLIMENTITNNLSWTIEKFAHEGKGKLTFPTKFDMVQPLLNLDHKGKTIFRMSVNPDEIIRKVEFGTSLLSDRIKALNYMADAGYPAGLLIAPVILISEWKKMYSQLIDYLADHLSNKIKLTGFIEIILMTYSFIHNAINKDAFPNTIQIFDRELMTGKGRGKYSYKETIRQDAELFLRQMLKKRLPNMNIIYIS
jgi:spore photoproduct lyase